MDAIATEVLEIVGEIAKRLSKCKIPEDAKGLRWYRDVIVHVLWNGRRADIEAQMAKLQAIRSELQFQIVISIKEKVDLAEIQRTSEFEALGTNLKNLVVALLDGEAPFASQLQQMRQQQDDIRDGIQGITNLLLKGGHQSTPMERTQVVKQLKDLLWFNSMPHRHDGIAEAHRKTFEWVFTGQQNVASSNTTFTEWVQSSNGLCWISGRAGSGKSSLMRFLNDDDRKVQIFEGWAGDRPLVIAPFYFWNPEDDSTDIELRRLEGLYQGLFYTILDQAPELAGYLFPDHTIGRDWGTFPTLADLKQAFARLLQVATLPVAIALIIDGLDEFDAPQSEQIALANMLKEAGTKPHLKVLVSSRPEFAFEVALRGCARIQLDELTANDRRNYVTDSLMSNPLFEALKPSVKSRESLITQIVEKSEGIFLWVNIVVSAIQEELYVARDIDALSKVVDETPHAKNGLFDLFNHILRNRIPQKFRARAFRMIWMLQECSKLPSRFIPWVEGPRTPHLATGLLYSFLEDDALSVKIKPLPASKKRERLDRTTLELRRYCAGLLEMRTPPVDQDEATHDSVLDPEVRFLHKDVSIFLGQQSFLQETLQPTKESLHVDLLACFVLCVKTLKVSNLTLPWHEIEPELSSGWIQPWAYTQAAMRVAREAEGFAPARSELLLDELDRAMTHHFSRSSKPVKPNLNDTTTRATRLIGQHWADHFPFDRTHFEPNYYPWPKPWADCALNFMSFAIQNGLFNYVQSKLKKDPDVARRQQGLPLLSCACAPTPYRFLLQPNTIQSRTVEMLLQSGVDPNEGYNGYSPWQMALLVALDSALLSVVELEELAKVLRLLLQYGADPKARAEWFKNLRIRKGVWEKTAFARSGAELIQIAFIDRFSKDPRPGVSFLRGTYLRRLASRDVQREAESLEHGKFEKLGNGLIALLEEKEMQQSKRSPLVEKRIPSTKNKTPLADKFTQKVTLFFGKLQWLLRRTARS